MLISHPAENRIYVGTHDGQVCSYIFDKTYTPDGKISYKSRMENKKAIGKKGVQKLEVISDLGKLFALSGMQHNTHIQKLSQLQTQISLYLIY